MEAPSIDELPVAVARIDTDHRVVWANRRLAEAIRTPLDRILGHRCEELGMGKASYEAFSRTLRRALEEGIPGRHEDLAIVEGERHVVDYRFLPEPERGTVLAVAFVNPGVERLQRAVHARERLLAAFLDHAPALCWLRDRDGRYVLVNASYLDRYGLREADIVGKTVRERWPGEVGEAFAREDAEVLASGEAHRFADRTPDPDGAIRTFAAVKFPVMSEADEPMVGAIALDITDRLALEGRVARLERLQLVAAHSAGVIHDLANDLHTISLMVEQAESPEALGPELLDGLREAAGRAASRVVELRDAAGKRPAPEARCRLGEVARETARALRPTLPPQIALRLPEEEVDDRVRGDARELQRVIENLVINAVEAIGGAPGEIRMALSRRLGPAGLVPGDYVGLAVADDGPGIPPELLETVFEPFVSSKGERRGLGLAGAVTVARLHDGAVKVRSSPGEGTTFTLLIPVAPDDVA